MRSENAQKTMTKKEIISKLTTIVKPYIQNEEGFKTSRKTRTLLTI